MDESWSSFDILALEDRAADWGTYWQKVRLTPDRVPQLPPEILYIISEFLRDDPYTLRSTSLVNTVFKDACRPLLFHTITLRGDHPEPHGLWNVIKNSTYLGHMIQVVYVHFPYGTFDSRGNVRGSWFHRLPSRLHRLAPNVHTLVVEALGSFFGDPTCEFFEYLPLMSSLKHLALFRCCLQHGILNRFVSSIPGLKKLHIHNHWVDASGDLEPFDIDKIPPLHPMPPLVEFNYHNNDGSGPPTHAFIGWLGTLRSLTTLRIHVTSQRSLCGIGSLLRLLGGTLEHLEIAFGSDPLPWIWEDGTGDNEVRRVIDITGNTSLRTLHLHNLGYPYFEFLLSQGTKLQIRTMILTDRIAVLRKLYDNRDLTLNGTLSSGYKKLEDICVVYEHLDHDAVPSDWAKIVLPAFESKGAVHMFRATSETVGISFDCCSTSLLTRFTIKDLCCIE